MRFVPPRASSDSTPHAFHAYSFVKFRALLSGSGQFIASRLRSSSRTTLALVRYSGSRAFDRFCSHDQTPLSVIDPVDFGDATDRIPFTVARVTAPLSTATPNVRLARQLEREAAPLRASAGLPERSVPAAAMQRFMETGMNYIAPRTEPLIREISHGRLALASESVRTTPPAPRVDTKLQASVAASTHLTTDPFHVGNPTSAIKE